MRSNPFFLSLHFCTERLGSIEPFFSSEFAINEFQKSAKVDLADRFKSLAETATAASSSNSPKGENQDMSEQEKSPMMKAETQSNDEDLMEVRAH